MRRDREDIDEFQQAAIWLVGTLRECERIELAGLGGFPIWEAPERVEPYVEAFLEHTKFPMH